MAQPIPTRCARTAVLLALVLVSACRGGEPKMVLPTPDVRPTSRATPSVDYPQGGRFGTLEMVGRTGGQIVEVQATETQTLNPLLRDDPVVTARTALLYNALAGVHPDTGLPYADLASALPSPANGGVAPDGKTYTFALRRDVSWHDGRPFTARDVAFTFRLLLRPELGSLRTAQLAAHLRDVVAPDDHTVVFTLTRPYAPFLVASATIPIVPEHILGAVPVEGIAAHPFSTGTAGATIGTGPFMFERWQRDEALTLVANRSYFRGAPALDRYVFRIVRDTTQSAQLLLSGEADHGAVPAAMLDTVRGAPRLATFAFPTYVWTYYAYQLDPARSTLFQQREVRQALAAAIDRESLIAALLSGHGTPMRGTLPPASWAYAPELLAVAQPEDLQLAARLLDAAGWLPGPDGVREKDGRRLAFVVWTISGQRTLEQVAAVLQQRWKAIGVEAIIRTEEVGAFAQRLAETRDFEIFVSGQTWGPDPDQSAMWSSAAYTGGINVSRFADPRVDGLLEAGLSELDPERRRRIYAELQDILLTELPRVILYSPQSPVAVNRRVHNLLPNAVNSRWNAQTWWVDDGR